MSVRRLAAATFVGAAVGYVLLVLPLVLLLNLNGAAAFLVGVIGRFVGSFAAVLRTASWWAA